MLSCTDGIATGMSDALLLVARLLSLHYPAPAMMSTLAHVVEWIVVISLVLGVGTRYGALLGLIFVVIAFVTAHRYWEFPQQAQTLQWAFLSKDLSIAGGLIVLFVTGGGRFSVDGMLAKK
jgi:putative oxidoreductase